MSAWQDNATQYLASKSGELWAWFDSLNREEWLIVLAACCAIGFLMVKGLGRRGPC